MDRTCSKRQSCVFYDGHKWSELHDHNTKLKLSSPTHNGGHENSYGFIHTSPMDGKCAQSTSNNSNPRFDSQSSSPMDSSPYSQSPDITRTSQSAFLLYTSGSYRPRPTILPLDPNSTACT
ncbi:hypothetical protein FXO38_25727 [Capsicum annuum]|nr:hypothetical protein FXO38_25727 [Capsicum annuum]KAF3635383.1 hypothetical protein FXO37_26023 [Capsicum annuum]